MGGILALRFIDVLSRTDPRDNLSAGIRRNQHDLAPHSAGLAEPVGFRHLVERKDTRNLDVEGALLGELRGDGYTFGAQRPAGVVEATRPVLAVGVDPDRTRPIVGDARPFRTFQSSGFTPAARGASVRISAEKNVNITRRLCSIRGYILVSGSLV